MTAANPRKFASLVYLVAAIYGFLAVPSLYLTQGDPQLRLMAFAFAGIALVFQGVFLVIARDPVKYAALLPSTMFEKISFGVPTMAFWARGQAEPSMALGGAIDLVFAVLFVIAWRKVETVA